jgi:TonB family protein
MKVIKLVLSIIITTSAAQAQIDTVYYDINWQKTDFTLMEYYRVVNLTNDSYLVNDFNKGGDLLMEGTYQSLEPEIENGQFTFYSSKGNLIAKGAFLNGSMVGKWILYNNKGKVFRELDYTELPKVNNDIMFSELAKQNDNVVIYDMPAFENNSFLKFAEYLQTNFILPLIPKKLGVSGRVTVQLIVDKNGEMINVFVQNSLHPHIDREIKRVIIEAPKWRPAENENGEKLDIPFTFTLEI